tara:strand:- start:194 stop:820 length:627 start_codon:yes stop_codon:yes gene_type:complete
MINKNINIEIFDNWALKDKDVGMEKGHAPAVDKMINIIDKRTTILKSQFSFLDLGCGNGWVVEKFSQNNLCTLAVGVDGANNMIKKAKVRDTKGIYYKSNIEAWACNDKFDIIFSMETFYYFNDIDSVLKNIYNNLLKVNSFFIFGIDHYSENIPSLSWESDIGIKTNTMSIDQWVNKIKSFGFRDVEYLVWGKKNDWNGTLIISAFK